METTPKHFQKVKLKRSFAFRSRDKDPCYFAVRIFMMSRKNFDH